ncbi:MAG: toprim domain-containing protein [Hyphomicrobiales bacterium]|jgi:putative DNA primase/helicase
MMDLRSAARALGGEVVGRGIVCPGPHHSRQDRSLSILFDAAAPGGFTLHSHAGDDFGVCRDHVRDRLGLMEAKAQVAPSASRPIKGGGETPPPSASDRAAFAVRIWRQAQSAEGSPVEAYLARRSLSLPDDAQTVIRYAPACPFAGERTPAMIALVRNVVTNQPQAVHRTALNREGEKVEVDGKDRLALGSIRGGAVKLTADEEVTTCLGIGEGIETTLSLRRLPEFGASPVWSVLNAGGITSFPVLPGIEVLWIAVDDDPAGRGASELCADRWRRAGREVFLVRSTTAGADLNDIPEVRHG